MANTQLYKFCELVRSLPNNENGQEIMNSWLPVEKAIKGALVNLTDHETGKLTCGWTIRTVSEPAESAEKFAHRHGRFGPSLDDNSRS